ncbi:MAG TPA: PRC-barrel domain-containing protein [Ramlibacter sp.]|nr:PRC-barrel domain-containing protein [Ramlibacter sp.]
MELLASRDRPAQSSNLWPGTSLCAQSVVDEAGEVLGSIVDLLLDLERGRIAYAVVASDGFMGLGERLVAVPWNALKAETRKFVLQGKRSALDSGPTFEREQWHGAPAKGWHESVHAHFGARPYWE